MIDSKSQKIRRSNQNRAALLAELGAANRAYQRAVDAMDRATTERLGINRTDASLLDVLEERGRIPAGELAAATGMSPGAVTTAIDRLEAAGYARRVHDGADRRRVLVELTARARRAIDQLYRPLAETGSALLDGFSHQELTVIRDFLRLGETLNRDHAARLRSR